MSLRVILDTWPGDENLSAESPRAGVHACSMWTLPLPSVGCGKRREPHRGAGHYSCHLETPLTLNVMLSNGTR